MGDFRQFGRRAPVRSSYALGGTAVARRARLPVPVVVVVLGLVFAGAYLSMAVTAEVTPVTDDQYGALVAE